LLSPPFSLFTTTAAFFCSIAADATLTTLRHSRHYATLIAAAIDFAIDAAADARCRRFSFIASSFILRDDFFLLYAAA